jgi:hypothetical protein
MPKFLIEPHFRLQEWVAEEKGCMAPVAATESFLTITDSVAWESGVCLLS